MSSVEVAVTHEIKIGRESAWVKVGINYDIPQSSDATIDSWVDTVAELVNQKIISVIEKTVTTVEEYEEKR